MQAKQNMHDFNEAIDLLFMLWILIISVKMIRGKITILHTKKIFHYFTFTFTE